MIPFGSRSPLPRFSKYPCRIHAFETLYKPTSANATRSCDGDAEDYVEAIAEIIDGKERCRVTDLAEHFAVSHVTVTKTVARLKKEGLVETEPYGPIYLTASGRALAENSRIRHEVVLEFLLALGVTQSTANSDSEGIEHHVSEETLQRMKEFTLRQPDNNSHKDKPNH